MNGNWKRIMAVIVAAVLLVPLGAAIAGTGTAYAAGSSGKVLKKGSKGEDVKQLQERLIELGYDPGEPDGAFGNGTRDAVIAFQRRNGLDADGQAGPKTLEKLYSDEAVRMRIAEPIPADVLSTDLPVLVNKLYPVDESFVPADLVLLTDMLDENLVRVKYPETQAVRRAAEALKEMLEAAAGDGITGWQVSAAYRSYADQQGILNAKINDYLKKNKEWSTGRARSAALHTVAEPGYSEHHLGLAIDINVPGAFSFKGTKQCTWLHEHCWEYGFIIRYPEDKEKITGYTAEAWHIRYVGTEHSLLIRDLGLCLEEYLDGVDAGKITPPSGSDTADDTGDQETGAQEIVTEEIILPDDEVLPEGGEAA